MDKIKNSMCFSCCFGGNDVDPLRDGYQQNNNGRTSAWIGTKASEISDVKDRCRSFVSRATGKFQNHRRRNSVGNFKYDSLSYALNFDEGPADFDDDVEISPDAYRYRTFSSRLPASPPMTTTRIAA